VTPQGRLVISDTYKQFSDAWHCHGVFFLVPFYSGDVGNFLCAMNRRKDLAFHEYVLRWYIYISRRGVYAGRSSGSRRRDTGWTFYPTVQ